jgi:putative Mn2+ efflux pump MntP
MLRLILFVLPLGLDTFAVSAALGASGAQKRERLRISLLLSGFEMAMPIVGLLGWWWTDPAAALAIAALAAREGVQSWRGDSCDCC